MNARLIYWLVTKHYKYIETRYKAGSIPFMGYGFAETDQPHWAADYPDVCRSALYLKVTSKLHYMDWNWSNADVLEAGSGSGGGAALIGNEYSPRTYQGIDISDKAIAFCRNAYSMKGLSFIHGNAESLPVAEGSVDLVPSIESSHC